MLIFNELHRRKKNPLKILLPVYPHSTALKNVIALNYLIILAHRNVEWWRPSTWKKLAVLPFLNVKSLVYLYKSCTITFCRRGYGLKENDSCIWFCKNNNTFPSCRWFEVGLQLQVCIYKSYMAISPNKLMMVQTQDKRYLPWIKSQPFRFDASMETTIEHDYHNDWLIVVTCFSH